MALPGTSWHYRTEPGFPNSEATSVGYRIPGTASEAGGRAFAAKRSFASARQRSCPANRARVTTFTFALQSGRRSHCFRSKRGAIQPSSEAPRIAPGSPSFACPELPLDVRHRLRFTQRDERRLTLRAIGFYGGEDRPTGVRFLPESWLLIQSSSAAGS
jgi:hypothetical protein